MGIEPMDEIKRAKLRQKVVHKLGQIEDLKDDITRLQALCDHEYATYKLGANTGNYDPSCDYYWADITCADCLKSWSTTQEDLCEALVYRRSFWRNK